MHRIIAARNAEITVFIYQKKGWPNFHWEAGDVLPLLVRVRHKQGLLLGRMRQLGFDLQAEASLRVLTSDVVRSSAIEGEQLDDEEDVRSSIARRLGLPQAGIRRGSRDVEGIVEVMLDATRNATRPITATRLCGMARGMAFTPGVPRLPPGAFWPALWPCLLGLLAIRDGA